jgi:hypothetical protein
MVIVVNLKLNLTEIERDFHNFSATASVVFTLTRSSDNQMSSNFQIIETWESQKGFEEFAERRLKPAITRLGIQRETTITFAPLHNFFGPRVDELSGLIGQLPGGPNT